jgi:predicted transcriptional regulator
MKVSVFTETKPALVLPDLTAEELMTPNPLSLQDTLSIREAIAFLIDRAISGAPVIDESGRPIGVLSQSDILVHDREKVEHIAPMEYESGAPLPQSFRRQFQIEKVDRTRVRDLMTPVVFSVGLHTPARKVAQQMCELNVHRLFVVDRNGILVGVISALDVLRHLNAEG